MAMGKVFSVIASFGVAVGVLTAPQAAAGTGNFIPDQKQRWQNERSGLCLVVRGPANEAPAVMSDCGTWADQIWVATDRGFLRNSNSGKCLTARTGQNPRQYECGGYADQKWEAVSTQNGVQIRNQHTGLCLLARGTAENSPVTMYNCLSQYADQRWKLTVMG
ncbi:RICIN domain-containing protein [Streptomyces silvensis]|uniref:RICIN domain-containing protein n=1 Tax=Streptomyces silvensis TaxID=1765722 RepID=UPI00099E320B|nr:RICIN domain-containing protein [Streptomyces silvensis]